MSFTSTSLLFLLFLLFLSISLYLLCMSFYLVVMDIPEGPKVVADPTMPTILVSTIPAALIPMVPSNFLTLILSSIKIFIVALISSLHLFFKGLCYTSCSHSGLSPVEVAPTSRFEVNSNFATIPDPMSKATAFFTRFNQAETNDLDSSDF